MIASFRFKIFNIFFNKIFIKVKIKFQKLSVNLCLRFRKGEIFSIHRPCSLHYLLLKIFHLYPLHVKVFYLPQHILIDLHLVVLTHLLQNPLWDLFYQFLKHQKLWSQEGMQIMMIIYALKKMLKLWI